MCFSKKQTKYKACQHSENDILQVYISLIVQANNILFIIHNISTRCDGNHFSETDFLYYSEKWRAQQIPSNKIEY